MSIIKDGAKRTHVFQIIVTLFIFNIKKVMSTPKQPVINPVLITYVEEN
jgi:putative effector of murein hydrolase